MRNVTMQETIDMLTRDLNRSLHYAKKDRDHLTLLEEVFEDAKGHLYERFLPETLQMSAPLRLQVSSLACIVTSILGTQGYVHYLIRDVDQAISWIAAWQVSVELDIDR